MDTNKAQKASKKFQGLLKKAGSLEKFVKETFKNESRTNLDWAVSDYEFQLAVHESEFADFVRNTAATVLQCDDGCVDECVNQEWVEFYDVPKCLKYCDCQQGVLDIEDDEEVEAEYNYPELIDYSEQDTQAWSFFKLI